MKRHIVRAIVTYLFGLLALAGFSTGVVAMFYQFQLGLALAIVFPWAILRAFTLIRKYYFYVNPSDNLPFLDALVIIAVFSIALA